MSFQEINYLLFEVISWASMCIELEPEHTYFGTDSERVSRYLNKPRLIA